MASKSARNHQCHAVWNSNAVLRAHTHTHSQTFIAHSRVDLFFFLYLALAKICLCSCLLAVANHCAISWRHIVNQVSFFACFSVIAPFLLSVTLVYFDCLDRRNNCFLSIDFLDARSSACAHSSRDSCFCIKQVSVSCFAGGVLCFSVLLRVLMVLFWLQQCRVGRIKTYLVTDFCWPSKNIVCYSGKIF